MNAIVRHDGEHEPVVNLPTDPMISMIERLVMNPAADLDKLERMLALKRDHDRDNARIAFAGALAAARSKIPPIVKDATVDFTSSKGRTHYRHETLAGIAKVIDPILSEFGLSYRFRTNQTGGGVLVTCIIAHSLGHSEETSLSCAPDGSGSKNAFQAVGSAVTYLQRYTLKAALGLSAEIDDDAQTASPRTEDRPRQHERHHDTQQAPIAEAVDAARTSLSNAGTMEQLGAIWGDLPTAVKKVQAVAEAKDARKADLTPRASSTLDDTPIPY